MEEEEWYFGDIDRRLAENKCKVEGDYMVRYSERQRKYVLTCKYKGSAKHFVIQVFTDVSARNVLLMYEHSIHIIIYMVIR